MLPKQGTATDAQYQTVLRVMGDLTPSPLNYEKAGEIISAINYAAAIRDTIKRDGNQCTKNLRQITQFIRTNLDIHIDVIRWAKSRFKRGTHNGTAPLRKTLHFQKVYDFASSGNQ
ncbi:hypothetical protein TH8_19595 [Thalassospira profundimaris]|nr:hypothetical protein TH8_19595 [Thalassospira profundimaris]